MRGRAVDKPFHLLVPRGSVCLTLCGRRSWWTLVGRVVAVLVHGLCQRKVMPWEGPRRVSGLSVGRPCAGRIRGVRVLAPGVTSSLPVAVLSYPHLG